MKLRIHSNNLGLTKMIAGTVLLALGALNSSNVLAYRYYTCEGNPIKWNNNSTVMYIDPVTIGTDGIWNQRLINAMERWNNVQGSKFVFTAAQGTGGYSHGNGINEIYFSGPDDNDGDALAVTHSRLKCYWSFGWKYHWVEADISFNDAYTWSPSVYQYNNRDEPFNFEIVALHELGHALGLGHEDRRMAIMNSYYPNSGPVGYYREVDPLGDDRKGARFLYPDSTTETDVAGSAFNRDDDDTNALVYSPPAATMGETVPMEFTFHNLSTNQQHFDVGFYLSTDEHISTSDVLLGMNYGAWGDPGFSGTYTKYVTIPANTAPGTYYLGFLIDPNNAVGETNEGNNIQPMPRTIRIGDGINPTVTWITPTAGQTLSGTVTLQVNATDNIGIYSVDFSLGGSPLGTVRSAPYQTRLDTATWGNGLYTFYATVTDTSGNTVVSQVQAEIFNPYSLKIDDVSKAEGNSGSNPFTFTVSLQPASLQTVTVNYATADKDATAGSDYTAASGTLTFMPFETSKTITVNVLGDTVDEFYETFFVNLSGASGEGVIIADGQGQGKILNDDTPTVTISDVSKAEGNTGTTAFVFTVRMSNPRMSNVMMNYATANGTAVAGTDYTATSGVLTFAAGQNSKTITVPVLGDTTVEPNKTFFLNLSGISGGILGDAQGLGTILNDD